MAAVKKVKAEKSESQKVSMNLTPSDMENLEYLTQRLDCRYSVNAVSQAMKIARQLLEEIVDQDLKVITKDENGNMETIKFLNS